jgi:D-alanyl-D-alanine carboxypeptidase
LNGDILKCAAGALLLCVCAHQSSAAQSAAGEPGVELGAERTAAIDGIAQEWLESTQAPSASIAIIEHGHLAYAQAYGAATLNPNVAATVTTRYAIDSVTKEFTAAAILLLAQQGRLSLDDPLSRWFPALGAASAVTLRQLLTHTSGIRDYWPQDFLTPEMTRPVAPDALIKEWAARPLDFAPGTDWQYSNTNYVLAAAVVEKISGQSLFTFLRQWIFHPLNMARVADDVDSPAPAAGDAHGYTRHGLGPVVPAPREAAGWLFGAGSLAMDPGELASWDLSLLNRSLLTGKSYDAEFAPAVLRGGRSTGYALGLHVLQLAHGSVLGHSGSGSGFRAENRLWPLTKNAIVVMSNNDWAPPATLLERIAFVLAPTPEQARADALFKSLQSGTLDRRQFSDIGNFYFTAEILEELHASLAPLGPPRYINMEDESARGGLTTRSWTIVCAHARLRAIERSRADGKFEEFLVTRSED